MKRVVPKPAAHPLWPFDKEEMVIARFIQRQLIQVRNGAREYLVGHPQRQRLAVQLAAAFGPPFMLLAVIDQAGQHGKGNLHE